MEHILIKPGDIVVTEFGGYQHWSLVTDALCNLGRYMLISATKRHGTVQEESWDDVTQGNKTYVADLALVRPVHEVLAHARSQIGIWKYSITKSNCEHFVKLASGLEVSSTQVKAGIAGAVGGVALVAAISENPKALKFLGVAVLISGLAIFAVKAIEKPNTRVKHNEKIV